MTKILTAPDGTKLRGTLELAQAKQNDREIMVTDAISEVDDRETQEALYAIFEYVKERLGQ